MWSFTYFLVTYSTFYMYIQQFKVRLILMSDHCCSVLEHYFKTLYYCKGHQTPSCIKDYLYGYAIKKLNILK